MDLIRILKTGISISDIKIILELSNKFEVNEDFDKYTEKFFKQKLEEAKKEGKTIWDGVIYRVLDLEELINNNIWRLGVVRYSQHIAVWDLLKKDRNSPLKTFHVSISSFIKTSDGYYVFGVDKKSLKHKLCGGYLQPDELKVHSSLDFYLNLLKELKEELNISKEYVTSNSLLGIVEGDSSVISPFFLLTLSLQKNEVIEMYSKENDKEFDALEFVEENKVKDFLDRNMDENKIMSKLLNTN